MIRLRFVAEHDPGSWLIRYVGAGDFSHVDIVLPDGTCYGARNNKIKLKDGRVIPSGVQKRPPDYAGFSRRTLFEVPCTDAEEKAFYDYAFAQEGKPYDRRSILGFVIPQLAIRDWRDPAQWFCDELAARCFEIAKNVDLFVPTNRIQPSPFVMVVSVLGGKPTELGAAQKGW